MIPTTYIQKHEIKDWFEDHPNISGNVLRAYRSCVPTLLEGPAGAFAQKLTVSAMAKPSTPKVSVHLPLNAGISLLKAPAEVASTAPQVLISPALTTDFRPGGGRSYHWRM